MKISLDAFHLGVMWNNKAPLYLLLAPLVCGIEAHAQAIAPRPTVTRAIDVFEGNPGHIIAGNRLAFKIRSTPDAQKIVRSGLQVRVFTLREDQDYPRPITTINDCDVFLSVVLKVESLGSTEAVAQIMDHRWLNLTDSLNSIVSGKYFLVFEQRGPDSEQFRLKRSDYDSYFRTGFQILVDKHEGISIEDVRSAYFERRNTLGRLRLEIDDRKPSVPCYSYRQLVAETTDELQTSQGTMLLCSRE